jgi:hypothetical protein
VKQNLKGGKQCSNKNIRIFLLAEYQRNVKKEREKNVITENMLLQKHTI